VVAGAALPLLPLPAVTSCQETKTLPPITDAGDVITLAFLGSLTGSEGAVGQPLKNAVKVAEWQINAAGGLLGKRVFFRVEDDASDPNKAGQLADTLIAAGIPAVIGPTASPEAEVATPKFFASHTVQISSTVTLVHLRDDQGDRSRRFFFRTLPAADVQGRLIANLAFAGPPPGDAGVNLPCRKMAIVYADDAYGTPFSRGIKEKFEQLGGSVPIEVKVPSDVKADYTAEAKTVAALFNYASDAGVPVQDAGPCGEAGCPEAGPPPSPAAPELCISIVTFGPTGAGFIKAFRNETKGDLAHDWSKVPIYGANALYTATFINNARNDPSNPASPTATEGMYGVLVDPAPETPEYAAFKRMYLEQFPLPAGQTAIPRNTANTYDAAILLALAIEAAGGVNDRDKIRDKLFDISKGGEAFGPSQLAEAIDAIHRGVDVDYKGASGFVDFDDFGEVSEDFIIWKIVNGAFTTVKKIKAAETL
jgi:ABC-type branched-subunit amino acid transport system substrate-binding protein